MTVQNIINGISQDLKGIPGVVGIVLGGSRARGTNHATSDIDIGIYYDEAAGFDVDEVSRIAARWDDDRREKLVTPLGGWGAWVNAGGWLVVQGYHVDLILRDIKRVAQVTDECLGGKVTTHYHAGHPHAYLNIMYMGEISVCKVLAETTNQVSELKAKSRPYPKALKDAIISYFMFEAPFSLMLAKGSIEKDDVSYVAGHCFRAVSCLNQALFALNEEYCINEKKAVRMIEGFNKKPRDYKNNIDRIFTLISANQESTRQGIEILQGLIAETETLIKDA